MIKKVLMLLICFIRVWELTMAQTSVVMGIVTSAEEGRLAIGVPVLIKVYNGSITGINGDFTISRVFYLYIRYYLKILI